MSDAISVECPKCHAKLKLKSRSAVGKRVPCPKCKTPFVVAAPPEGDDIDFMNVSEPGADEFAMQAEEEQSEELAEAAPAMGRRSSSKKRSTKMNAAPVNWQKPALLGGLVVLVVGLLGGGGYFLYPLIADLLNGNKIDMAWLPPDSDMVVHARVADAFNSPFVKEVMPAGKGMGTGNLKDFVGFGPEEIRSFTFGASGSLEQMQRLGDFVPMGGFIPGAPGMPRGPGNAGMPAAAGPGSDFIAVLRTVEALDTPKLQERIKLSHTGDYQTRTLIYSDGPTMAGQVCFLADSITIVVGGEKNVKAAIDRGPRGARRADLDFIDATRHVLVVFAPKDPSAFDANGPPSPMGGQTLTNLQAAMQGKRKGSCLGLTFGQNLDLSMVDNCTNADAAKEVSAALDKALQEWKTQFNQLRSMMPPQFSEMVVLGDGILNSLKVQTHGTVTQTTGQVPTSIKNLFDKLPGLMMAGMMGGLAGAGAPPADGGFNPELFTGPEKPPVDLSLPGAVSANPFGTIDEPAERARSRSNLREIGLAMMNFEQANGRYPAAAIRDPSGKPLLSWRVSLLLFVDQGALYKEFHLNEPWNSDHNKSLIARMPDVFACPNSHAAPGSTSYLAVTGPGSVFEGSQSLKLLEILDGTSNTMAIVEANDSRAVPWTCPDDLAYDPSAPMNGLVGHHAGGFLALTCDGAVHFISEMIDPKALLALFTRSGGETVDVNAVK
jgi:hypothetical protein